MKTIITITALYIAVFLAQSLQAQSYIKGNIKNLNHEVLSDVQIIAKSNGSLIYNTSTNKMGVYTIPIENVDVVDLIIFYNNHHKIIRNINTKNKIIIQQEIILHTPLILIDIPLANK